MGQEARHHRRAGLANKESPAGLWPRSGWSLAVWLLVLSLITGAAGAPLWWPRRDCDCERIELAALPGARAITSAQEFHRGGSGGDRDSGFDYGELTELGQADLVDQVLASDSRWSFSFRVGGLTEEEAAMLEAHAAMNPPGSSRSLDHSLDAGAIVFFPAEQAKRRR